MRGMASLWLVCLSSVRRSGETTGRRLTRKTQSRPARPRKIWKTWSGTGGTIVTKVQRKGFQVWRGSSGQSLNTSAIADTLLTEGFLEAGGSSDCLKKDWRKPAAPLLRLAISFRTFGRQRRDKQSFTH